MCHTQKLDLMANNISDAGLTALAKAVESGALASLKTLYIHANPCSDEAKAQLKAACQPRGITGSSFLA